MEAYSRTRAYLPCSLNARKVTAVPAFLWDTLPGIWRELFHRFIAGDNSRKHIHAGDPEPNNS